MNIEDGSSDEPEDVQSDVKIQRVHRSGKSKNGKPRPILARFLRYKYVQKNIFTRAPIKRNRLPNVLRLSCRNCQKTQRADEDLQRGQKKQHSYIPFSLSEPDKLFIRGRLWPVEKKTDH